MDLIDAFCDYSASLPSSRLYRVWAGIALAAGALERRVWTVVGHKPSFSNLFIMLVGPPGAGKQCIQFVNDLWTNCVDAAGEPIFNVGQDSYTKASLLDDLDRSRKTFIPNGGASPLVYHSLLIAAEEFPTLFPIFDSSFLSNVSDLWNAKPFYEESRRTSTVKHLKIEKPFLSMIMGYQPAMMAMTLPQAFWGQGFARRTIMVWSGDPILQSLFNPPNARPELQKILLSRLKDLSELYGHMHWEDDAAQELETWHLAEGPPTPTHSRLIDYFTSRSQLVIKLSMIASVSDGHSVLIVR